MSDEAPQTSPETEDGGLDPAQLQYLNERLASEQNLGLGVVAGLVASVVGAAVWAGVTFATEYQIGFMAIGIGFAVGYAVRLAGKGITPPFGVVGAVLSLLGCALGNLLTACAFVASDEGVPFFDVVNQLDMALIQELMTAFFSPMDLVFYAIAVYYGYKLSFREVTGSELSGMLGGGGTPLSGPSA